MIQTILVLIFEFGTLELIWYLVFGIWCFHTTVPPSPSPNRYFSSARFAAVYPVLISIPSFDFSSMQ
jgi:hypothetical protein